MRPDGSVRYMPGYFRKFQKLVLRNGRLTPSNFIDILADVYQRRPAFCLDAKLNYSFFQGDEISYQTLLRFVNRIGNGLRALGARKGDRIGLVTMNRIELAFAEYACMKIGCVPVPFNFLLKLPELRYQVENCGARILLTDRAVYEKTIQDRSRIPCLEHWIMVTRKEVPPGFHSLDEMMSGSSEVLAPLETYDPEAIGFIFYTSGTTGLPKGAALTNGAVLYPIRRYSAVAAAIPFNKNQLALLVMPIAHSGGNQNMILLLSLGIPMLFVGRFHPKSILQMIQEYKATFFAGIPTMYRMLLEAGARECDLTSIRCWGGGADSFSDELIEEFRELAARKKWGLRIKPFFIRGYGLAETNSTLTLTLPWATGQNCIGWTLPRFKHRIVDKEGRDVKRGEAGQLLVKGPTIMREYWNDPEKTSSTIRDGWFHTGDVVRQDRFRLLYFIDREKDIIKCSGWPIYPNEIERTLEQHPGIERACVIGAEDKVKGELPVAMVTLRPGCEADPDELHGWARERIAAYKCPRYLVVVDSLPLTISLKTRKVELRKIYEEAVRRHGGHANRVLSSSA
jgi:long-chain acyl-CoA synthetase